MIHEDIKFAAEVADARLILRWAAMDLTGKERACLEDWLADKTGEETARRIHITRGGVWMLRKSALQKMKRRLRTLGITSTSQMLGEHPMPDAPIEVAA